jgi:hypothetical protein
MTHYLTVGLRYDLMFLDPLHNLRPIFLVSLLEIASRNRTHLMF